MLTASLDTMPVMIQWKAAQVIKHELMQIMQQLFCYLYWPYWLISHAIHCTQLVHLVWVVRPGAVEDMTQIHYDVIKLLLTTVAHQM